MRGEDTVGGYTSDHNFLFLELSIWDMSDPD